MAHFVSCAIDLRADFLGVVALGSEFPHGDVGVEEFKAVTRCLRAPLRRAAS